VTFAVADRDESAANVKNLGETVVETAGKSPEQDGGRPRSPGCGFALGQFTPPEV
jgi:hypothetical protein